MKGNTYWALVGRVAAVVLLVASKAWAQPVTANMSLLRPPEGARVAIVMFEDLQCPACAHAHPMVVEVSETHHVPLLLRDFPLLKHPWSFEAAVYARFFASKSEKLSRDYRIYIFQHQTEIEPADLRPYSEKFAAEHDLKLPSVRELPDGLARAVQADFDVGKKIGIRHTPTVFVVTDEGATSPLEVSDPEKLSAVIEDVQAKYLRVDSRPAVPPAAVGSRPKDYQAHPRK